MVLDGEENEENWKIIAEKTWKKSEEGEKKRKKDVMNVEEQSKKTRWKVHKYPSGQKSKRLGA